MAIRKEEEKKVGMKITDNMDGEEKANEKLQAKYQPGITSKELNKLPGDTIQEKIERKLGIKVMPNITLEKAIELINKKRAN